MNCDKIRIGMIQLLVEGGEPKRNLARAVEWISKSKDQGCEIVLLPEVLDLGWTHPSAKDEAQPIPGPYSDLLCGAAQKNHIHICAGLTEKEGSRVFNSAILINDTGEIILKYHKINLLVVEQEFYEVGRYLSVVDTKFGLVGVNICADNYHDSVEIGHTLARMGAQIILSPSAWTSEFHYIEGQDPYGKKWFGPFNHLASLFNIVVVGCTSVGYIVGGPYEGKKMVGCSMVVGEKGIISKSRYNEFATELIVADVTIPTRKEKGTMIGERLKAMGYYR